MIQYAINMGYLPQMKEGIDESLGYKPNSFCLFDCTSCLPVVEGTMSWRVVAICGMLYVAVLAFLVYLVIR